VPGVFCFILFLRIKKAADLLNRYLVNSIFYAGIHDIGSKYSANLYAVFLGQPSYPSKYNIRYVSQIAKFEMILNFQS